MKTEDFLRAFVATMSLQGIQSIETSNDAHHARFHKVVDFLTHRRVEIDPPFIRSVFTDRYHRLNYNLLLLTLRGYLEVRLPNYNLAIVVSQERAYETLAKIAPTDADRLFFKDLIEVWQGLRT